MATTSNNEYDQRQVQNLMRQMKDYKEFTFGWLIFVFVIPTHLLLT